MPLHLAKQFCSLWNVGHLVISNVVLRHYLNSQPPLDINLISFFFFFLFSFAYKRENWSNNTRKDDLHIIWYRLHSAAGAMFHSRFLVLQTVSVQANQKVIHCCFS